MSSDGGPVSLLRRATATGLSLLLIVVGVALVLSAEMPTYPVELPVGLVVLVAVPVYLAGHRYSLDYEVRKEAQTVTLVQLPLALGVQVIAPLVHLAARLVAALLFVVTARQNAVKALFNIGTATFELGVAALAFHARELGLDGAGGPIVAIVSGGNVDPEHYRAYLEAPIPPER